MPGVQLDLELGEGRLGPLAAARAGRQPVWPSWAPTGGWFFGHRLDFHLGMVGISFEDAETALTA